MKKNLIGVSLLYGVFLPNVNGQSLLPDKYLNKQTYLEQEKVFYEMINHDEMRCLSLQELSQYHGYSRVKDVTELVDEEGKIHIEEVYLEEKGVRDDWMEGYGRVYISPTHVEVYSVEGELIFREVCQTDSMSAIPLSKPQAINYGRVFFGDSTIPHLEHFFSDLGASYNVTNGLFKAKLSFGVFLYDDRTKSTITTQYDTNGHKMMESSVSFSQNDEGFFYPDREVTVEWISTKNGCCVRKTTIVTKSRFHNSHAPLDAAEGDAPNLEAKSTHNASSLDKPDFLITQIPQTDDLVIRHVKGKSKPLNVQIFDVTGRKIIEVGARSGEVIKLPITAQSGMYLVHVYGKGDQQPTTGKIILTSSNELL